MPLKRRIVSKTIDEKNDSIHLVIETTGYPKLSEEEVQYLKRHPKTFLGDVEVKK